MKDMEFFHRSIFQKEPIRTAVGPERLSRGVYLVSHRVKRVPSQIDQFMAEFNNLPRIPQET